MFLPGPHDRGHIGIEFSLPEGEDRERFHLGAAATVTLLAALAVGYETGGAVAGDPIDPVLLVTMFAAMLATIPAWLSVRGED
jgi:hypothetical protein